MKPLAARNWLPYLWLASVGIFLLLSAIPANIYPHRKEVNYLGQRRK